MWLASAALSFADGRTVTTQGGVYAAGMGAALLLGNLRNAVQARVGLAMVLGSAAIVVYNDPSHDPGDLVFTPALFGLGWLVGFALRERAVRTEAAEERAALAERDREAAGRTALSEMRRLLGAMRQDDEAPELVPHPGLAELDGLLSDVRAAGLAVRLRIHGEPFALPPGLDLSAYRIVQEALTNTLKHAHAHEAEVEVHYGPRDLELEVRDDGRGPDAGDGLGHGLVGIGERVKIYGGDLSAGPSTGGGFVLRARLPVDGGGS